MIYIALPEFFLNNLLIENFTNLKKYYFKTDMQFHCATGNFSYCYWNGGFNNNRGKEPIYVDFLHIINSTPIPIRFNCANIFLNEDDYDNVMANLILSLGENASNSIAISNLNLFEYLKEKYPDYKYVFSKEANLYHEITPEIVNTILENDDFLYLQIPENKATDFDFLMQINKKSKLELPINYICSSTCFNHMQCQYHEHQAQYNYSGINNYFGCSKNNMINELPIIFSLEDLIDKYVSIGIKHFYVNPYIHQGIDKTLTLLIKYFIKEEYQAEVLQLFFK